MKQWVCGVLSFLLLIGTVGCRMTESQATASSPEPSSSALSSVEAISSEAPPSRSEPPSSGEAPSSQAPAPSSNIPSSQPQTSSADTSSIPEFSGRTDHVKNVKVTIYLEGMSRSWYLDGSETDTFMKLLGNLEYKTVDPPESTNPSPGLNFHTAVTISYEDGHSDSLEMDLSARNGELILVQSGGDELESYFWSLDFLKDRKAKAYTINYYIARQAKYGIPCSLEPIPEDSEWR